VSKAKPEGDLPTQPRRTDEQGRELDQWGLPLNGPFRLLALEAAGKPDPNIEPGAWADVSDAGAAQIVAPAPAVKEKANG
jgi:hypothetical protein